MLYDVFISYSHRDNIAPEEEYRWVDCFHKALYGYLTGKLNREAKIWRDETNMRGNAELRGEVLNNARNSLIFLPILSPNFLSSQWCVPQELRNFLTTNKNMREINKRIFPVLKTRITTFPPPINQSLIKYAFHVKDNYGNLTKVIDPSLGETVRNEFNQKIIDLAQEIADFIMSFEEPPPPSPKHPLIYLAEPSPNLFDKYLEIKRDLEARREQGQINF